ncbi:MAG: hypothetical protein WAU70_12700 [Flavobacteriales bacterium]
MTNTLKIAVLALFVGLCAQPAFAQTQPEKNEAKRIEDAKWRSVVMIKYHAGKMKRAMEIVDEHFRKASAKAGTPLPELEVRMTTGEWDVMVVWLLTGGIDDLNWETSPDNVKFLDALAAQEGGMDKAKALREEYNGLISNSQRDIARQR